MREEATEILEIMLLMLAMIAFVLVMLSIMDAITSWVKGCWMNITKCKEAIEWILS